ncbi:AzlD domain-containing protein [Parendozoicomonas haliclonae]|uniref:Branched-chain amino acid transport protein (AzlD) n=1 Tax=Parendozoicomonas haliclonae TaxID=1960125 RepID=A0A1X7AEV0_9GAMM|nr:AzlD domain-containing protein [Parendozoicomonas haliclonae]SMA35539.1 Branched-chain amino acid transport protein (AzlD) [Parendozoicomonas haliclonae]
MSAWWLIIGMALITFSIRYVLIATSGRWQLPQVMETALKYVPVAVLTVIIVQTIMVKSSSSAGWEVNPGFLLSALVAFAVARLTKSLMITVMVGLVCYGGFYYFQL